MKFLKIILLILFTFACTTANSFVELRSDFFTSFQLSSDSDFLFRSHTGLYLGGMGVAVGAVFLYEPLHDYVTDTGYGGAFRIGDQKYIELSGGYFERKYENLKGKGYFVSLIPGLDLSESFGFTLPIIAKKISSGELEKRWIINFVPFISWRIRI